MPEQHTVQDGETILKIADQHGFRDWKRIYDAPENASLRETRPDPMVLAAGDVVTIPDKEPKTVSCTTNALHTFQLKPKLKALFRLILGDELGVPRDGVPYTLEVGSETFTATTGDDGVIEHEIPIDAVSGTLTLFPDDDDEREVHTLEIGSLKPVDDLAGVQSRLNALGYACGEANGRLNDRTKEAIEAFQEAFGHEDPNGEMDDWTREALVAAHDDG